MLKHKRLMLILSLMALLGLACGFTGLIGGQDLTGSQVPETDDENPDRKSVV